MTPEQIEDLNEINTPIRVDRLGELLERSGYDEQKTQFLVNGFKNRFDTGYRGPEEWLNLSRNIPITVGSHQEMWDKVMKEVELGRYSGPFEYPPYYYFIQSPIGLVPKAENQTRLIFHLSFNFSESEEDWSVNYHTPTELCSVKYNDLDYAVKTCINLIDMNIAERKKHGGRCVPGENVNLNSDSVTIFFAKSDLCSTFRLLPVKLEQRCYLMLKAEDPRTGETRFFV